MQFNIEFQAQPRKRILGHSFNGITVLQGKNLWWSHDRRQWVEDLAGDSGSNYAPCNSYKAFLRHLRRHADSLKGCEVRLTSRYIGYDIVAKV